VQQKLSASHSVCSAAADCETAPARRLEGLSLKAVIGRGGYGVCYRGIYRGTPVAVKVRRHAFGLARVCGARGRMCAKDAGCRVLRTPHVLH
jgi:L,D-peptidoglycan transpeptidase YkuD (ErfK/YbiS/YcfS/YnhG family)